MRLWLHKGTDTGSFQWSQELCA